MRRKIHRDDIIEAGLQLIHLQGYHATGIKDITDTMNIPKGSFYNHFKSKEAFGLEVLERYRKENLERLDLFLKEEGVPPVERIRRFFQSRAHDFRTTKQYRFGCLAGNFGSELGDVNDHFAAATDAALASFNARFDRCLQEAVREGDLPATVNTRELAEFITSSWQGTLIKMKISRDEYPLKIFFTYTFDVFLNQFAKSA